MLFKSEKTRVANSRNPKKVAFFAFQISKLSSKKASIIYTPFNLANEYAWT